MSVKELAKIPFWIDTTTMRRPKMTTATSLKLLDGDDRESTVEEDYERARTALVKRVESLRKELRAAEQLLGEDSGQDDDDSDDDEVRPVELPIAGSIQGRIHAYVLDHGGSRFHAVKKGVKLNQVQAATALNAMKRKGLLRVTGRRGAYRYYVASGK
jgi:hypothetical protein